MTFTEFSIERMEDFIKQTGHFPTDLRSQYTVQASLFMKILEAYHTQYIEPLIRAKKQAEQANAPQIY